MEVPCLKGVHLVNHMTSSLSHEVMREAKATNFQLCYVTTASEANPNLRKTSKPVGMLQSQMFDKLHFFKYFLLNILCIFHTAAGFPHSLCCGALVLLFSVWWYYISATFKQAFNFSGISGCANDHLHVKNEHTHYSAATHKYRRVQNWRLQYAIQHSVFVPCSVQFIVGEACTYA